MVRAMRDTVYFSFKFLVLVIIWIFSVTVCDTFDHIQTAYIVLPSGLLQRPLLPTHSCFYGFDLCIHLSKTFLHEEERQRVKRSRKSRICPS